MSYEVLARKWRPQTFDELVGQDHVTRTLKKAVESGRIAHAYLLSGPRGCGKTSTARILAKVIDCQNLQGGNPCNACDSCNGVMRGNNLDVMEIDGASHTGVSEVRDLQESIGYAPSQFSNKVYIIDEVHMLSMHAFNALLKTLEEPPSHVYFIFATTAPHKIPDTIKSRCQRHQFKRLEIGEIVDQLEKICEAEKTEWEADALRLLARKAEGSMRDGESLLDQCITASAGSVTTNNVQGILGLLDQEMVSGFLGTIASRDATAALKALDEAIGEGVDIEELLNAVIEGFRDLMVLAAPGDLSELIFRSRDEIEALKKIVANYELGDLVTIIGRLCNLAPRMKTASDPRILMESALVDIALLEHQTDIRELIANIERSGGSQAGSQPGSQAGPRAGRKSGSDKGARRSMEAGSSRPERTAPPGSPGTGSDLGAAARVVDAGGDGFPSAASRRTQTAESTAASGAGAIARPGSKAAPAAASADKPAPDVDLSSLDYGDARRLWEGFATFIRQKKLSLGVCLISGTLKSMDDRTVLLRFAKGFTYQKEQVYAPPNKQFLAEMTKKYFGRELELICFIEGEEAHAQREKLELGKQSQGEPVVQRAIETQPVVRKILDDFDGEIVRYHPQ